MSISFGLILLLIFVFGYLNGLNAAGSIIATVVSSRALNPRTALIASIICLCVGPSLFGLAVAGTISADLVYLPAITSPVVIAALGGAILWISLAAWLRLPCSTTHAFIASLVGAACAGFGVQAIIGGGLLRSLAALMFSPLLGIVMGYAVVKLCYRASVSATPRINYWFQYGQVAISLLVALSFGSNEGQKIMGMVALGFTASSHHLSAAPNWAAGFSALALAAGTLIGSSRVAHTLGRRLYTVRPIHGFGAQAASGIVLVSASLFGSPVSGSQVITSAIVGAGCAERWHQVRWGIFGNIFRAWVLTLPAAALAGAAMYVICVYIGL